MPLTEIDSIPYEDRKLYFDKSKLLYAFIFLRPKSKSDAVNLRSILTDFNQNMRKLYPDYENQVGDVIKLMQRHQIFKSSISQESRYFTANLFVGIGYELGVDYRDDVLPGLVSKKLIDLNGISGSTQQSPAGILALNACVSAAMITGTKFSKGPGLNRLKPFAEFIRTIVV